MNTRIILWAVLSLGLTSCFKAATQSLGSTQKLIKTYKTYAVTTESTDGGGVSGAFDAKSSGNQLMQAAEDSTIKEAAVVFPPGALAINATIRMEEAAPIASAALTSEIGIDTQVMQTGTAVAIVPEKPMDAQIPFVLKIPIPVNASLMLDDPFAKLVVMYRVNMVAEGKTINGIIPRSEITIQNGVAEVQSLYFGSFQAAFTSVAVTDNVQAVTKAEIITKQESAARPALAITSRLPFVTKADGAVEIRGVNFRPTMIVALGGKKVAGLKVESDSKASFIAPSNAAFGLADVTVEQEGVTQTVSVFYSGTKNDFPIMMKADTEVCAGEKFYDASGALKTGKRNCDSVAVCTQDGQTNCLANADFPAVQKQGLGSKVVATQSVAGVNGLLAPRPIDCSSDGGTNCVVDGTLFKAAKLSNFNAGQISSGVQIAGVTGSMIGVPSPCNTDGQENCVANAGFPAVDKITKLTSNQSKIRSGLTIAGVSGSLGDCSSDGATGCVVMGPSYASMLKTGAETKIVSGHSLGGVNGNAPGRPADCSSDGVSGCVTTPAVTSMVSAGAGPKIVSGYTLGGVAGQTLAKPAACTTGGISDCVTTTAYPSVDLALVDPLKIRTGLSIAGIAGALMNCSVDGDTGCVAIGPNFAAAMTSSAAAKILSGQTLAGISGTAASKPADCSADGATSCVATTNFPALDKLVAAPKIVLGQTVGGVTGTASGTAPSDCASDGELGCKTVTAYPAMKVAGAAAKIAQGEVLATVSGTAGVRPGDCLADGATGCVAVASFPAVDKNVLTTNIGKIWNGITLGGVPGALANCSSDGAMSCLTVSGFPAMASAGAPSKIVSGYTLGGMAGTAPPPPASCSGDGQTNCLTNSSYPSIVKSMITSSMNKFRSNLTIAGVTGTLSDCLTDGSTGCVTTGLYPAVDSAGLASKIVMGSTAGGVPGTASGRFADCASDGQSDCSATSSFPAVNKSNLIANLSSIKQGVTIAQQAGALTNCSTDNGTDCVTSTAYPSVIRSSITPAVVKKSMVIAGVTGDYPSMVNPLSDADSTVDLTSSNFLVKIKDPANFEFFDSAGTRYVSQGSNLITQANIKDSVTIFGVTGTLLLPTNCSTDGAIGCVTTSVYKAANTGGFTEWDIRKNKTVAGIPGKFAYSANGANLTLFNRSTGDDANASSSVADIYDSIEDWNNGGAMPALALPGTIVAAANHFVRDTLSDTNANDTCDGVEHCVYIDHMTGLRWAKAQAAVDFETAISACKSSTYGGYSSGWRLPTQKELMGAYINGINSYKTPLNVSSAALLTATTLSTSSGASVLTISLGSGMGSSVAKTASIAYMCVRSP